MNRRIDAAISPAIINRCSAGALPLLAACCPLSVRWLIAYNLPGCFDHHHSSRSNTTTTQQGQQLTVSTTDTETDTITEQVTSTVGPDQTVTVTQQTTVTPVVVKPKICNASGLPGPDANNYYANYNSNQAACIASCKTDNKCLSTGFYIVTDPSTGATSGTCRYYTGSVADSDVLGPGYYTFNDKAC